MVRTQTPHTFMIHGKLERNEIQASWHIPLVRMFKTVNFISGAKRREEEGVQEIVLTEVVLRDDCRCRVNDANLLLFGHTSHL
jgi:hypothetical protein